MQVNIDRHIRRSGDDYATALASLLPYGQAWPRGPESVLMRAVRGLAQIFGYVDGRAGDLLERESDPRKTIELLPDWERAWGLPDPCFKTTQSIAERQTMLVFKMTLLGAQDRQWFIDVSKWLGYDITISEFAPFTAGISQVGDTRGMEFWNDTPGRLTFVTTPPVQHSWFQRRSVFTLLSDDKLTATKTGNDGIWSGVVSNASTSEQMYVEAVCDARAGQASGFGIGVVNTTASLDNRFGADKNGIALFGDGDVWFNGVKVAQTNCAFVPKEWVGVFVDRDAKTIAWRNIDNNGDWTDPIDISAMGNGPLAIGFSLYNALNEGTINFDQAFLGRPPTDTFTRWDGTPATTVETETRPVSPDFRWRIGPPEMRFYWQVHVHEAPLMWFRVGSGRAGKDPHLRIGFAQDLECLLRRWKPAQTDIVFDYSNLTPDNKYAGLP
jgi:uncharacterized protein YmfQ (DUF2313 family)